jgi:3-hydroxyisobutyrate dehydrogenase
MAQIGVIGLGNIGAPIASNLIEDGHEVSVHDTDPKRVAALVERGASEASDAARVAEQSEFTFASLPTPDAVETTAAQWLSAAHQGGVFIDLSTNSPACARRLGVMLSKAGRHFLEAPLTGGAPGAAARQLLFMVGGDRPVFERCRPILERLGRATIHVGEPGLGNTAKLVNSLMAFSATLVSLEGLAVAHKSGIAVRAMIDVIRAAGTGNIFTNLMVEGINQRGRPASFSLALAAKDAALLVELAREVRVPTPIAAQVAQSLVSALGAGMGERDFTDLVELIERQAALTLKIDPPADKQTS